MRQTATPTTQSVQRRRIRGQTLREMILRGVEQQRAAVDHGDPELAEMFARCTAYLLDQHLHGAAFHR